MDVSLPTWLRWLLAAVLLLLLCCNGLQLVGAVQHANWNSAYLLLRLLPLSLGLAYLFVCLLHLAMIYQVRLAQWYAYRTMLLLLLFYAVFFQALLLVYDWAALLKAGFLLALLPAILQTAVGILCFALVARQRKPF